MSYIPPKKILEKYARVLVDYALGGGKGIKRGDVVYVVAHECAKALYGEIRRAILKSGGHVIGSYRPDSDVSDKSTNFDRDFYTYAKEEQLTFFPAKFARGLIDQVDHSVLILSETNKQELKGIDPKKIMKSGAAWKPFMDWRNEKENKGKFTWTLALFGTPAMAKEAGLSEKEYWKQIIQACFLDKKDPVKEWEKVFVSIEKLRRKLNNLAIDFLHVKGPDADIRIKIGEKRRWMGGSGRNIPSFELFTSPDWRGTEGWIRFNQPLYRYGNLIKGIQLVFKNGKVIKATAKKNQKLLRAMIATKNADKIGEYSLTDRRYSRITKFMAETLFDENMGGKYGNTHLALGKSYQDCYRGNPADVTNKEWERLGFNDSSVHTDIVSTSPRTVTAYLKDGTKKVIYKNGQFTL